MTPYLRFLRKRFSSCRFLRKRLFSCLIGRIEQDGANSTGSEAAPLKMPGQGRGVTRAVSRAPARSRRSRPLQFVLVAYALEGGARRRRVGPAPPQVELEPAAAVAAALKRTHEHVGGLPLVQEAVRNQAFDRAVDFRIRVAPTGELRPQLGREMHAPREQVQPPVVGRLGAPLSF